MSEDSATSGPDRFGRLGAPARALLARAGRAEARARDALRAAIDDAFLPSEGRLEDRARAALGAAITAQVTAIAGRVSARAAALLVAEGQTALAETLGEDHGPIVARLAEAGLLRDSDLMSECIARVRVDLIAAALPLAAPDAGAVPSVLARLAASRDAAVADAARALLIADNRRQDHADAGALPAELYQRLLWWTSAALRERAMAELEGDPDPLDRAIAEAALDDIAAHRATLRVEDAAVRLAAAIDADADELPALIEEALRDARLTLFIALVGHALGIGYDLARDITIDTAADRLVLVLRALELPRDAIARIGLRLDEADPRRDIERFVDALDAAMTLDPQDARGAVAPLRLHPDYRAALAALAPGR